MDVKRARELIRQSNISYTAYRINPDGSTKVEYQITNKDYQDMILNSIFVLKPYRGR